MVFNFSFILQERDLVDHQLEIREGFGNNQGNNNQQNNESQHRHKRKTRQYYRRGIHKLTFGKTSFVQQKSHSLLLRTATSSLPVFRSTSTFITDT